MCFWAYADSKGSDQPEQGLRSPLTESSNTIEYINGEQMPRWDFGDVWGEPESVHFAQADIFSLGAAQIYKSLLSANFVISIQKVKDFLLFLCY